MIAGEWQDRKSAAMAAGRKRFGDKWGGLHFPDGHPDRLGELRDELVDAANYAELAMSAGDITVEFAEDLEAILHFAAERVTRRRDALALAHSRPPRPAEESQRQNPHK